MPTSTDFSVSPYFDDWNEAKNFHKVLFKPATPVQVRELNQLQTILQNQIERFGNNVYKRGTIIDGVNFQYFPDYAYAKINDNQLDGEPSFPALYVGHFARDASTNLIAQVINSVDGFEATDPNLKTLYLRYINSGNTGLVSSFSSNSILTIYDYDNSVQTISINNGSSGFSNADAVTLVSALAVSTSSSNTFANGEYLTQTGKRAIIIGVDALSYPGKTILKIKPDPADLANTAVVSDKWTFATGSTVTGNTTSASATVTEVIGDGAAGTLISDGDTGKITKVSVTKRGAGYYVSPYATVKSAGKTTPNYTDLDLVAKNFIGQVKVANTADSTGVGYAFGVSEGVIYQKGFFVRVTPQVAIVSKYDPLPNGLSVGFVTQEAIIDSNIDESLKDNVIGSSSGRPGADRLNLIPQLIVVDTQSVAGNTDFLSLADFSAGQPYRQNYDTQFNSVETEMAARMNDTAGNFVIDKFQVTTRSSYAQADEGAKFAIITDPGRAYVNGKRVETQSNFVISNDKGLDTASTNNVTLSIDYGNYIVADEVGGSFQFTTGDTVDLYNTPKGFQSNSAAVTAGDLSPIGTKIGTARLRSMVADTGVSGTPAATYRFHVFDIEMLGGANFKDTRSIYYNGAKKGIADAILTSDNATAGAPNTASIVAGQNRLVFPIGLGVKNITGIEYIYRTMKDNLTLANTGQMTISLAANTSETFGYNAPVYGTLTSAERKDVYLVPTSNSLVVAPNGNGTISVSTSSNTIVGTGTLFTTQFTVGDHIFSYGNTTTQNIGRVTSIANNTQLTVDGNVGFTNAVAVYTKVYPKNIPVPLDRIPTANVSVDGTGDVLTINIGASVNSTSATTVSVAYDVLTANVAPQAKIPNRNLVAKIAIANNAGQASGPWCLGVPDIFRLKNVYVANSSTVNTASQDITDEFYIDHNQNANYLDLGYLYQKPKSSVVLNTSNYLLAVFDAYTSNPGVYTVSSYVSANQATRTTNDSLALGAIGGAVNSFEVPEVYTYSGDYYDLIDCIDFRPVVANTVPLTNVVASAVVNPSSVVSFGNTADPNNDHRFPLPETSVNFNVEQFLGRKDLVVLTDDSAISVIRGTPSSTNYVTPQAPGHALLLNTLNIPPYPNLPKTLSANTSAIIHTGIANERFAFKRITSHTIDTGFTQLDILANQPTNYTMADIGNLERRIQDLESQVALNTLESQVKDLVIPSSVDPSISRFKYGFYVDNFDNGQFSDLTNPEFHAEFISGKVVPPSSVTLISHGDDTFVSNPAAREYVLISQPDATVGTPADTTTIASGVVTQVLERQQADENLMGGPILTGNHYTDTVTIDMSTIVNGVQSCTLYLYNYSSGDRVSIYKGPVTGSPITSTLDAVALTQADIDYLKTQPFFTSVSANLKTTLQKRTILHDYQMGWDVLYGAKIVFQHNPADGNEYTIVTEKGPQSAIWRWQLNYPVDASSVSPSNVPSPVPAIGPDPAIYTDFPFTRIFFDPSTPYTEPRIVDPVMNGPTLYAGAAVVDGVISRDAGVQIEVRGLKPFTDHQLVIDPTGVGGANVQNLNLTDHVTSVTNPAQPLMTDAQGKVTFILRPTLVTAAWGQPSAADSALFDKLKGMSYPGLNKIPLLLNGGQNLGLGNGNYIFGSSFVYFDLPWLDYSAYNQSYVNPTPVVDNSPPPAPVTSTTPSSPVPSIVSIPAGYPAINIVLPTGTWLQDDSRGSGLLREF